MIPYAACMGFRCGPGARLHGWQPFPQHPQRRGAISFHRIGEHKIRINVDEIPSRSTEVLRGSLASAEWALLQMLDLSEDRPRNTGKFLTLNRKRRRVRLRLDMTGEPLHVDDVYNGQTQCALTGADRWPFNAFTLDAVTGGRSLPVLLVHLFGKYGLIEYFELDPVKVWKCFNLVEEGYHSNNPYHNSIHASDVSQAMHCFLQEEKIAHHVTPMEIMAALLAAVCHDLDHPGVNQPFLIATSNHLAALYKNASVLESHHWRSAVACLMESGIFNHFGKAFWEDLVWQLRSLILATDITRQQEFLMRFKRYMDSGVLDMTDVDYRHFILQIALKCADICNPCRPWDISKTWSDRVCEEFFRQGDFERQLNLPVTSLCDRYTMSKPKIQAGFFRFVVLPLFEAWDRFQQTSMSEKLIENLKTNQNEWEKLAAEEAAEETSEKTLGSKSTVHEDPEMEEGSQTSFGSPKSMEDRGSEVTFNLLRGRRHSMPLSLPRFIPCTTIRRQSFPRHKALAQLRALSAEALMPDPRITSISAEASRLAGLFTERRGSRHLVKQMTYPPISPQPHIHSLSWQEACAELLPGVICPSVLAELSAMQGEEEEEEEGAIQPLSSKHSAGPSKTVAFCTTEKEQEDDGQEEEEEEEGVEDDDSPGHCKNGCGTPPTAPSPSSVSQISWEPPTELGKGALADCQDCPHSCDDSFDDNKENARPEFFRSRRDGFHRQLSEGSNGSDHSNKLCRKSNAQGATRLTGRRGSAPVGSISRGGDDSVSNIAACSIPRHQRRRGSAPFDSISGLQQGKQLSDSNFLSSRRNSLPLTRWENVYADSFRIIPSGSESGDSSMVLRDQDVPCFLDFSRSVSPDPFGIHMRLQKRRSSVPTDLLASSLDSQCKNVLFSSSNHESFSSRGSTTRKKGREDSGGLGFLSSLFRTRSTSKSEDFLLLSKMNEVSHEAHDPGFAALQGVRNLLSTSATAINKMQAKQSESFDLGALHNVESNFDSDECFGCNLPSDGSEFWMYYSQRRSSVPVDVRLLPNSSEANS